MTKEGPKGIQSALDLADKYGNAIRSKDDVARRLRQFQTRADRDSELHSTLKAQVEGNEGVTLCLDQYLRALAGSMEEVQVGEHVVEVGGTYLHEKIDALAILDSPFKRASAKPDGSIIVRQGTLGSIMTELLRENGILHMDPEVIAERVEAVGFEYAANPALAGCVDISLVTYMSRMLMSEGLTNADQARSLATKAISLYLRWIRDNYLG